MSTVHIEFDIRGQLTLISLTVGKIYNGYPERNYRAGLIKSLNARGKCINFCSTNSCPFRDHL